MNNEVIYIQNNSGEKYSSLKIDCLKLGVMLILYRLFLSMMSILGVIVTCRVLSGEFHSYNGAVDLLKSDYADKISTSTYSMLMNTTLTTSSLILTLLFGWIVLGFSFRGYLKPSVNGAKTGLRYFPACFVMNIVMSAIVAIFVNFMDQAGVTIPEADFSIDKPSTAAVALQFLYIAIMAPLIEEIVYRGMILSALSKYGEFPAIFFSALCFGLMHGNIPQAVAAFGTGLMYACIAVSCNSIMPSLVIHSLNNIVVSFSTLGKAMGFAYTSTVSSIMQILAAVIGFYVLLTRASAFSTADGQTSREKKKVMITIFTRPAVILYLVILIIRIADGLIESNAA
ncbi:CPBP family intramembrane glutamic endopeptidase [Ruminococcus albus]|uniref:CPBP family intramembrane glutamic endopeptidase n=1 Tax=Ruminococcus albus TaxID=1264 RepID=UPI00046392DB|nr:CPBP family intramembrane glutamic endopeptidase [Ruminococcus albus]